MLERHIGLAGVDEALSGKDVEPGDNFIFFGAIDRAQVRIVCQGFDEPERLLDKYWRLCDSFGALVGAFDRPERGTWRMGRRLAMRIQS